MTLIYFAHLIELLTSEIHCDKFTLFHIKLTYVFMSESVSQQNKKLCKIIHAIEKQFL